MIPSKIEIHPATIGEARKAYRWYLRRSAAAAGRFQAAFDAAIEQIALSPGRWPGYMYGTRCRPLRRFQYLLVYRQIGERLQIVAVAHGSRKPAYWKRRM
jgi:plasmid stabilization system protein ParE